MGSKRLIVQVLLGGLAALAVFSLMSGGKPTAPAPMPVQRAPKGVSDELRGPGMVPPRPIGTWASHAPRTMKVGVPREVALRVEGRVTEAGVRVLAFAAAGSEKGTTESGEVVITPKMSAKLTGLGFQIESSSPPEQSTGEKGSARWTWQVLSTTAGTAKLHLVLSAHDAEGPHVVVDRELPVTVEN